METIGVAGQVRAWTSSASSPATAQDETLGVTGTASTQTYRVRGASRPGGHGRIRCNTTEIRADTGSVSDGYRPGPAELLCAALAGCLLKNIERYSELLPFQYEVASVEVEAERQDGPPRMTRMHYRIEIATDEPTHRVDLLHRNIRKYGTITNTLAAACQLTGEIQARPTRTNGA
jgi:uncharacterized OsmC-like protein